MNPIHFGVKRSFWLVRALGGLAMATAGGAMAMAGKGSPVGWMGIIGVLFFGAAVVVGLIEGTRRGPRLTLDAEGVHDRTLRVGVIAWTDIASAEPYGVAGKPFVGLHVREPAKYLARAPRLARFLARLHAKSGLPPFSVNLVGLDADPVQVADLIMGACVADEPRRVIPEQSPSPRATPTRRQRW